MKKNLLFVLPLLFTTLGVQAQSVVFEETFDSFYNEEYPSGWIVLDRDGDNQKWLIMNNASITNPIGFTGMTAFCTSNSTSDDMLITPEVNLQAGNHYSLTFLAASFMFGNTSEPDTHYAVYVLPSSGAFTGTETPVFEEVFSTGDTAELKTVDISEYAGQMIRIGFRHLNGTNSIGILLDDIKIIEEAILGIKESDKPKELGIYPNPASDYIYLKPKAKMNKVEIFDTSGRKMHIKLEGEKIDVRNLQAGIYLLKLETEGKIISQKFIKK